jgi:hypothetical protein
MSDAIDNLIHSFADQAAEVEKAGTSAGYFTYVGLLATFLREVKPVIEADLREELRQDDAETPERAAERIVLAWGDERRITAIKEYRDWLRDNGHDSSLKAAKDGCDEARSRLVAKGLMEIVYGYPGHLS